MQNAIDEMYSPWLRAQNRVWETVTHLGQKRFYDKGSTIIHNNQPVDCLYYLHTGQAKYFTITSEGHEKILWYLEKGNVIGAAPFFDRRLLRHLSTALVAAEKCEVYTFSRQCFENEISVHYPELLTNLIQSMAYKIFLAVNRGGDLDSLVARVCKILYNLVQRNGNECVSGKVVCDKGISQQELAYILGIHRVTLNYAILRLKNEGIISSISKRHTVINHVEQLLEYI